MTQMSYTADQMQQLPRLGLICLVFLAVSVFVQSLYPSPLPEFQGMVTDEASLLSKEDQDRIASKLRSFQNEYQVQIFIVTVDSLDGESVEDYAQRLFEEYQPGRKGVDDGIIFLVAKNDRKMRIHTGRGVEGVIPDAVAKRILDEVVRPYFKDGEFALGIDAGATAIIDTISKGDFVPVAMAEGEYSQSKSSFWWWLTWMFNLPGILILFFAKNSNGRWAGFFLGIITISLWILGYTSYSLDWPVSTGAIVGYIMVCGLFTMLLVAVVIGELLDKYGRKPQKKRHRYTDADGDRKSSYDWDRLYKSVADEPDSRSSSSDSSSSSRSWESSSGSSNDSGRGGDSAGGGASSSW